MARKRALIEQVEQQVTPAREKQRAIVELNLDHVSGARGLQRQQIVANLRGARAEVVATVADERQPGFGIDRARVRCPQSPRRGIDDARIFLGRPPSDPAAARLAPRMRHRRVVVARAPAPGPSATSRCDPSASAATNVLHGRAGAVGRRSAVFDVRRRSRNRACASWWLADRAPSTRARADDLLHRDRRSAPSAWSALRATLARRRAQRSSRRAFTNGSEPSAVR